MSRVRRVIRRMAEDLLSLWFGEDRKETPMPTMPAVAQGRHTAVIDGLPQSFHVHGSGPVCVVHPGGPGADWSYIRLPALEEHLTVVYIEPCTSNRSAPAPQVV